MKSILILGGARCVWGDVGSLGQWPAKVDVAAVNDVGAQWPGSLIFWASLHPRKLKKWEKLRKNKGHPDGYEKYGNKYGRPMVDHIVEDWGGSSGLFAVKIALLLGYEQIVLAGIPMEAAEGHYFNNKDWKQCDQYRAGWGRHETEIKPYVRSCSGWTMRLLGAPDIQCANATVL